MKKIQILVIDDEKKICENLVEVLTQEGYIVKYVLNGSSALRLIKKQKFHIAILDLKMPKMNGCNVFQKIKKIKPNLAVIVLTGHPSVESAVSLLKEGAIDYLKKPYSISDISRVIRNTIKKLNLVKNPSEEFIINLANNIRYYRKKVDISANELARRANLSPGLISQVENARTIPSVMTIYKIANSLKLDIKKLF